MCGIIPAHAGLTSSLIRLMLRYRDHPRACGAHASAACRAECPTGSSPRMRGSHVALAVERSLDGIIPAHAGLTVRPDSGKDGRRDHPRACGAHVPEIAASFMAMGSSPRMRGSLFWFAAASQRSGIIPAHAGLTISGTGYRGYRRDHPRACGAHHCTLLVYISMQGSSPRMRGSPAGEWYESRCRQDHPRACGAHPMNQTIVNNIKGSSPRMRGSLSVQQDS